MSWDNTSNAITGSWFNSDINNLHSNNTQLFNSGGSYDFGTQVPYRKRKTINIRLKKGKPPEWTYYPRNEYYAKPMYSPEERMSSIIKHYNRPTLNIKLKKNGVRDVLFVPGVAFGLVAGRDLTMEAQRRNEIQTIHITGRQSGKSSYARTITGTRRFNASVLPQSATCRMTLVDEPKYKRPNYTINIRLPSSDTLVPNSQTLTNKTIDYSPWTQDLDMGGNDLTDLAHIGFSSRPCINIKLNSDRLTYEALLKAKDILQNEGIDPSNLVLYTTPKAIRDLTTDPDLDSYIGYSRPEIITESTIERIAGVNIVKSESVSGLRVKRPCINFESKRTKHARITNELLSYNDIEEAPIDLISSVNRSYALEAINEESKAVLASDIPNLDNLRIDVGGIEQWKGYNVITDEGIDEMHEVIRPRLTITIGLKGKKEEDNYEYNYDEDYDDDIDW